MCVCVCVCVCVGGFWCMCTGADVFCFVCTVYCCYYSCCQCSHYHHYHYQRYCCRHPEDPGAHEPQFGDMPPLSPQSPGASPPDLPPILLSVHGGCAAHCLQWSVLFCVQCYLCCIYVYISLCISVSRQTCRFVHFCISLLSLTLSHSPFHSPPFLSLSRHIG